MQALQDQKSVLTEKLLEYDRGQADGENASSKKLDEVLEENANLKEQLKGFDEKELVEAKLKSDQELAAQIEEQYRSQIQVMEKKLREVQAENSEIKAKQLMNAF